MFAVIKNVIFHHFKTLPLSFEQQAKKCFVFINVHEKYYEALDCFIWIRLSKKRSVFNLKFYSDASFIRSKVRCNVVLTGC